MKFFGMKIKKISLKSWLNRHINHEIEEISVFDNGYVFSFLKCMKCNEIYLKG